MKRVKHKRTKQSFIKSLIQYLTPYWVRYYRFQKQCIIDEFNIACICSMNDCPDDFYEDYLRYHRGDEYQIDYLRHRSWKFGLLIANYLLCKVHDRCVAQYNILPWNLPWNQEEAECPNL